MLLYTSSVKAVLAFTVTLTIRIIFGSGMGRFNVSPNSIKILKLDTFYVICERLWTSSRIFISLETRFTIAYPCCVGDRLNLKYGNAIQIRPVI